MIFWPRHCYLCGAATGTRRILCDSCQRALPRFMPPFCLSCGEALPPGFVGQRCRRCIETPLALDGTQAGFVYRYPVDVLVRHLKYGGVLALARPLAEGLAETLSGRTLPDVVMAVPLSPRRQRRRGYNQAHEIAIQLSRQLGCPLAQGLRRVRDTEAQAGLNFVDRRNNLKLAFACPTRFEGVSVALVDDVMTTGATLDAAARVLKDRGARRVGAWVVARTPPPEF